MWPIASWVLKVHQAVNGVEVAMNSQDTLSSREKKKKKRIIWGATLVAVVYTVKWADLQKWYFKKLTNKTIVIILLYLHSGNWNSDLHLWKKKQLFKSCFDLNQHFYRLTLLRNKPRWFWGRQLNMFVQPTPSVNALGFKFCSASDRGNRVWFDQSSQGRYWFAGLLLLQLNCFRPLITSLKKNTVLYCHAHNKEHTASLLHHIHSLLASIWMLAINYSFIFFIMIVID